MPPYAMQYAYPSSESDSEDAPESISLSQSKKDIQKLEADRRIAEATQRKARKEKNRELDRKLKERSAINKDIGNGPSRRRKSTKEEEDTGERAEGSGGRNKANVAEERMKRAIQEAEGEDKGSFAGDNEGYSDEEDHSVSEAGPKPSKTKRKPHHLPDELFEAAFSSKAMKRKVEKDDVPLDRPPKKQRPPKSKSEKDIVVGWVSFLNVIWLYRLISLPRSRTIRVISDSTTPSRPSWKATKFLNDALALKPGEQSFVSRGWERRPGA